jgi:L-serine dehydratase
MYVGLRDLFKIGIGPSSSHTVGPMRAAALFVDDLRANGLLSQVAFVHAELYGSLALTGRGHGTDVAVLLGLEGLQPDIIDPETIAPKVASIRASSTLQLGGTHPISFVEAEHLIFRRTESLPFHPNGMRFSAFDQASTALDSRVYYSIGGGFVYADEDGRADVTNDSTPRIPFPFRSADELLLLGSQHNLTVADLVRENERASRSEEVAPAIHKIWQAMQLCVARGLAMSGPLPGPLQVRRRASAIAARLAPPQHSDGLAVIDWTSAWAMAANEENACGGRVVTAPTNGAAGVIPAVLHYYTRFVPNATDAGVERFFLTATAIGALCKTNASISGAEVGCQGEVGVACAMAAAGLVAALEGTNAQVEQAAEIGIEHHLGMTCDPVGGLVQIPCIERNAIGAVKAITAARMAMSGDGTHRVSLDQAIATMRDTGRDMQARYKETSLGGLALTVIEC